MSVTTLPVKAITVSEWALITSLYDSFAVKETAPYVGTTVTAEVITSGNSLLMAVPE